MKISISTFVDYLNTTQLDQESLVEKLKLQSIVIRRVDGKSFLSLDDLAFNNLMNFTKVKEVLTVDPLLQNGKIYDASYLENFEKNLDLAANKAKQLKSKSLIYRIPLFEDVMQDRELILTIIKRQIAIIKKYKLDVLIMPDNDHKASTYRFIFENLKDNKVKMVFHPVYLYKLKEAEITAYRLLRDYIGMFLVDDCDEFGTSRLITTGQTIELKELFKKFITNNFEGFIVLDTGLNDVLKRSQSLKWYEKTFSKTKKNDLRIYEEYTQMNQDTSVFQVLKVQLLVLNLVFLNKKTL
ncbi:hypothetical protein [Acholeplasma hippikon]|uniref:Uncharacterized protein n=1 Tax=Acholeplasma hippikon TaxID=264636 RepID=A0A449BL67_9MOLU|nr:hypothetical protein [Acholeplasma hippikon]VEU83189.1 Uncharacterised protein [Acholeplasma hippikon]